MLGLLNSCPCTEFIPAFFDEGKCEPQAELEDVPASIDGLDAAAAYLDILARKAGAAFAAGLQQIVEEERHRLKEERLRLQEEWQQLELQRLILEEGKPFDTTRRDHEAPQAAVEPASSPPSVAEVEEHDSDMVRLNIGGQAQIEVSREALTQCRGSRLSSDFSRPEQLQKDENGHIIVEFSPEVFMPLVEHLCLRQTMEAFQKQHVHSSSQVPVRTPAPPAPLSDPILDDQFVDMLRYYGVLDWVYGQRPVNFQVRVGSYDYSVLPPQPPDMGQALNEMRNFAVTVPRGWQVLNTSDDGFDRIIWELTKKCWGTSTLIARDGFGDYAGFRTPLAQRGNAASRLEHGESPARWFDDVSHAGTQLRFANVQVSCRLVIRSRVT